ncbi:SDR family oxidoreductase [Algiphilus sp.]|uniref:SDR family oxidoreductase n=1 Tax=Algiphilus sp. TaxID=1872431 RepID=UPI003BAAE8FD
MLQGKLIVISGIGPGLGVKLAEEAARAGAAGLVVSARTAAKLEDAEARVRAVNPDCQVCKQVTDITDAASCKALVDQAVTTFGRIDGLVNSAFVHGAMDYASTADIDSWMEPIGTNLLGTLKLTQAVAKQMQQQKHGAIVMINTMAVRKVPPVGEAGYAASKAALATSVKYLAKELGPDNIRVNTVHMGWMWGAPVQGYVQWQAEQSGASVDDIKAQIAASIPLGIVPPDEECARSALFFVSDYSRVVTGASLDVNGGEYMP